MCYANTIAWIDGHVSPIAYLFKERDIKLEVL